MTNVTNSYLARYLMQPRPGPEQGQVQPSRLAKALARGVEGFRQGFGDREYGMSRDFRARYPGLAPWQAVVGPADVFMRATSGLLGGASGTIAGTAEAMGMDETSANRLQRDLNILGIVSSAVTPTPAMRFRPAATRGAGQAPHQAPPVGRFDGSVPSESAAAVRTPVLDRQSLSDRGAHGARGASSDLYPMFPPPPKPPRALTDDYRNGVSADASGRLTRTMDGDPLVAENVAGWTEVGAPQRGLSQEQVLTVMERLLGKPTEYLPESRMGKYAGATMYDPATDMPTRVLIREGLDPDALRNIQRHEASHVIEQIAGLISTEGHTKELNSLYGSLNNPKRSFDGLDARPGDVYTPWHRQYPPGEVPREYIAEAIRAYMTDPNYIKTVAPNVAAAIRRAVNSNPLTAPYIQFNSLPFPKYAGLEQPSDQPASTHS